MSELNQSNEALIFELTELKKENEMLKVLLEYRTLSHELEIKKSESLYASILNASPDTITITDLKGNILFISPMGLKMFEFDASYSFLGHSIFEYIDKKDHIIAQTNLSHMLQGTFNGTKEYTALRADGSMFNIEVNGEFIRDMDGQPVSLVLIIRNISDRKKAEESLKQTEEKIKKQNERLNAIISAMPDLIFVTDQDGNYLEYYNSNESNLLLHKGKLVGTNIRSLFNEETSKLHLQKINDCIRLQKLVAYEYTALADDTLTYFEVRITPMGTDKVLRFVREITEKKIKDTKLKKLSLAVEQCPVSIVITDLDANIEYINPAFQASTGYSPEELMGNNMNIIRSGKTEASAIKNLWNTVKDGRDWHGELINKKKTGELIWVQVSITAIQDEMGEIVNYLAIQQDITKQKKDERKIRDLNTNLELKIKARTNELAETNNNLLKVIEERKKVEDALSKSEQSYKSVVENVKEIIFKTDNEGLWLFLNKAWEEVTGFSVEESLGKLFFDYIHPDDKQRNAELFLPLIERKKEYCRHQVRYLTKSGGFRWIEVFARLGLNDQNETVGTFGTLLDITDSKEVEDEIRKARLEAERANMEKSEFLSRMSHELRTPMNSILGFAQLLQMGELNPIQKKGVNHILRSGKHLLDLINEVLDISRIEAGRLSLSMEPVQCFNIILEMIDVVLPLAQIREITINVENSASNQLFVRSDRQRLKQVLLNLLNNAVKYNKTGGAVTVKTEKIQKNESDLIRISIMDTGVGIRPEDMPKLFNPFERIGAERTDTEGTGLGLAVVKKLIDALGGDVGVESTSGEGSTFWIEIPHVESQLETIHKSGVLTDSEVPVNNRSGTILYIEDNTPNIELVEQILYSHRPGVKLITNMNGLQAVHLANEYHPDLILLDMNLPDIHGSEVIKLLHEDKKAHNIPIVVVSADAMPQQHEKMIRAGARNYLTKPLDVIAFLKVIDAFIVHDPQI